MLQRKKLQAWIKSHNAHLHFHYLEAKGRLLHLDSVPYFNVLKSGAKNIIVIEHLRLLYSLHTIL